MDSTIEKEIQELKTRIALAEKLPAPARLQFRPKEQQARARLKELEAGLLPSRQERITELYSGFYRELPYRIDAEVFDIPEYKQCGMATLEDAMLKAFLAGDEKAYSLSEKATLAAYDGLQAALERKRQVRLA